MTSNITENKDIKTNIIEIFNMFKKLKQTLNMFSRHWENI